MSVGLSVPIPADGWQGSGASRAADLVASHVHEIPGGKIQSPTITIMRMTIENLRPSLRVLAIVAIGIQPLVGQDENKTEASESEHALIVTQLGWGYDINGRFCHEDAFTRPIFMIADEASDQRDYYRFNRSLGYEGVTKSGKSAREFSDQLAASAGVSYEGGAFSGELELEYGYQKSGKSERSYVVDQRSITRFRVRLEGAKIRPEVQVAIDTADPETVIRTYGAFYASDLYYGAKLSFRSSAENTEETKNESIDARVVASGWGVTGKASASRELNSLESKLASNATLKAYGGDAGVLTQSNFSDEKYEEWQNSIKEGNIALAHFGSNSLKPIWDLATTGARQQQLKATAIRLYPKIEIMIAKVTPPPRELTEVEKFALLRKDKAAYHQNVHIYLQEVTAQDQGGEYVTDAHNGTDWYFPILGSKPQKIKLSRVDRQNAHLKNGDEVWMWYDGSDVGSWNPRWQSDRWLYVGANQNAAHWCENGSGAQYNWRIYIKGRDAADKEVIKEGDQVYIENAGYPGKYLQREQGKFLDCNAGAKYWLMKIAR